MSDKHITGREAPEHLQTVGARLRWARIRAGFEYGNHAAQSLGIAAPTYHQYENGSRGIPVYKARQIARRFKIRWEWLLEGEGHPQSKPGQIPVVGYVGAGEEVFSIDDHEIGGGFDYIDRPPGTKENAVAVRIAGNSMHPVYRDGDIVIYDDEPMPAENLLYKECVTRLSDGRVFIKRLLPGSKKGVFTLESYNAPPIIDQPIEWAAKIKWILRG